VPLASLEPAARTRRDYRGFAAALAAPHRVRVIAEIKRASPSKGDIGIGLDPAALARAYEAGGAAALSVLTDAAFFKGSPQDLAAARAATRLPVLRKDFVLDPYQVYESAAMGADAILLIVRILTDDELRALHALARELGLDVLVEIHTEPEAERANRLGARLIGINNRDLARFDTDLTRARRLAAALHPETVTVAASGIATPDDVHRTVAAGVTRFLVGESLVRAADPAAQLRTLIAAGGRP
jgi:indole-3-glycerol phosphate synthase